MKIDKKYIKYPDQTSVFKIAVGPGKGGAFYNDKFISTYLHVVAVLHCDYAGVFYKFVISVSGVYLFRIRAMNTRSFTPIFLILCPAPSSQ